MMTQTSLLFTTSLPNDAILNRIYQRAEEYTAPEILRCFDIAMMQLTDDIDIKPGYWLRVDPVIFKADINSVYLIGQPNYLTYEAAQIICAELNNFLKQDNLEIIAPHPLRWYLRWPSACRLDTPNPISVLGASIQDYLRESEPEVKRLFTELQMLLARSKFNQQLLVPITGLWFWGGGYLKSCLTDTYDAVIGDNSSALRLSKLYGIAHHSTLKEAVKAQNMIWVIDDYPRIKRELIGYLQRVKAGERLVMYEKNAQCRIYQPEHFLKRFKKYVRRFRSLLTRQSQPKF